MQALALTVLEKEYSIYRLSADYDIPTAVSESGFYSLTHSKEERSLVCESDITIESQETNSGWACIKIAGPLDFSLTGILAGISSVLAKAKISIFVVSTFETDYILVKTENLNAARKVLSNEGYHFE